MEHYQFRTSGVCAQAVEFDLEDGKAYNIKFYGGCNGNLKAISTLLEGMDATEIIAKLQGNSCGGRPTSCADQLTKALQKALEA